MLADHETAEPPANETEIPGKDRQEALLTPEQSPATEVEETAESKSPAKQSASVRRKSGLTYEQVVAYFSACGRCSYFLAGYQVDHGLDDLQVAIENSKSGWLALLWDRKTLELVHKSFGVPIDIDCYHYESYCGECRRHFIYRAASEDNKDPATFRLEVRPHGRR
jgi:hypothetical protein